MKHVWEISSQSTANSERQHILLFIQREYVHANIVAFCCECIFHSTIITLHLDTECCTYSVVVFHSFRILFGHSVGLCMHAFISRYQPLQIGSPQISCALGIVSFTVFNFFRFILISVPHFTHTLLFHLRYGGFEWALLSLVVIYTKNWWKKPFTIMIMWVCCTFCLLTKLYIPIMNIYNELDA